jgi:hypothetical protein
MEYNLLKLCSRCREYKFLSEFSIKKNGKHHSWCHDCRIVAKKEWDIKNKNHVIEYNARTKDHRNKKDAEYRESHREELRLKSVVYNERLKERRKLDRLKPDNRERERARGNKWRKENRERYNKYFHDYYEKDESKKIGRNLRNRLRKVLKGKTSEIHSINICGCNLDFLKTHLVFLFQDGMSMANYGKWHIDHIIPCDAFDFHNTIHQRACFYWRNLQPMWSVENISKNDNYNIGDFNEYMDWFMKNVINK